MKTLRYTILLALIAAACNVSETLKVNNLDKIPTSKNVLQSNVVMPLNFADIKNVAGIVKNNKTVSIGLYNGLCRHLTVNTEPSNSKTCSQSTPKALNIFNSYSGRLREMYPGVTTRSGGETSMMTQLPAGYKHLRAVNAGSYIIATGLYEGGKYMLYDPEEETYNFHLSYADHPAYPEIKEKTKAILYASTVLKVRPDNQAFVCADMYSGTIDFCQITTDRIERIKQVCYHHPKVYIDEIKTPADVAYSRDNRFGFTDVTVTNDRIYATYSGRTYRQDSKTFQQCRTLMIFDWEGNLRNTYALDTPLTNITFDEMENAIYGIGYQPTPALIKIQVPEEN